MADPIPGGRSGRRTFAPLVLLGLVGAGLAAVGGHKTMLAIPGDYLTSLKAIDPAAGLQASDGVDFPLAGALALVTLAGWGVVLVTRGIFRRIVVGITALAAAGIVAVLMVGGFVQDDGAAKALSERLGATETVPLDPGGWFWATLAGAVLALLATLAGLRLSPAWPEMGTKYDAPTAGDPAPGSATPPEEQSNLELWKSLDEGNDPTR